MPCCWLQTAIQCLHHLLDTVPRRMGTCKAKGPAMGDWPVGLGARELKYKEKQIETLASYRVEHE